MTDTLTAANDADARAAAAQGRAVSAEARADTAENQRDVYRRTAEAAEAGIKQAVGERDSLAHRLEEATREAGRQQGVNEVLKEQLQQKLQGPQAPADLSPVVDSLARIEQKLDKPAPVISPAPGPAVKPAVRQSFWQRERESGRGFVRTVIWIVGLLFILAVVGAVVYMWRGHETFLSTPDTPSPIIPNPTACTVPDTVYVDMLERCVRLPPPDEDATE
jgi:hypothetical protein